MYYVWLWAAPVTSAVRVGSSEVSRTTIPEREHAPTTPPPRGHGTSTAQGQARALDRTRIRRREFESRHRRAAVGTRAHEEETGSHESGAGEDKGDAQDDGGDAPDDGGDARSKDEGGGLVPSTSARRVRGRRQRRVRPDVARVGRQDPARARAGWESVAPRVEGSGVAARVSRLQPLPWLEVH